MIKNGDMVTVIMANTNISNSTEFDIKLIYRPQGAGDCFYFEQADGTELVLNGNSSDFIGIREIHKASDD